MVIKKLYLTSFGKFDNLEIDLSSGMNVIYGLNEAGKSTVHKFIEGMLFGFFKPSTSRKTYFEDYDKYKPRTKDEYIGSMIIEHNNKDLFISRNFSKTKASLSINDNITGEDLTSEIENNPITKLPDLAGYLGLDYTLYKNTISVSQLGSEDVEKDTSKVVVEKLTNMNSTKSEFINLTKINENLDKMIDKIGNKSKKKKPLYLTQLKIEELKAEKETSENAFEKMRLLSKEISLIDTDIIMCNKNLTNIKNKRLMYDNELLKIKYFRALEIEKEKSIEEKELQKYMKYEYIDSNGLPLVVNQLHRLEEIKKQHNKAILDIEENNAIIQLHNQTIQSMEYFQNDINLDSLKNHYSNFSNLRDNTTSEIIIDENLSNADLSDDKLNNQFNAIIEAKEIHKELYKKEKEALELEYELKNATILADNKYKIIFYIILIPFIVGLFLLYFEKRKQKEKVSLVLSLSLKQKELQEEIANLQSKGIAIDKSKALLVSKYWTLFSRKAKIIGQPSFEVDTLNILSEQKEIYDNSVSKLSIYQNILQKLVSSANTLTSEIDKIENKISEYFKNNKVDSLEQYKEAVVYKNKYNATMLSIKNIELRLKEVLYGQTFDELKNLINFDIEIEYNEDIYQTLKEQEEIQRDEILKLSSKKSTLVETIRNIELVNREQSIIDQELDYFKKYLSELVIESSAIKMTQQVLDKLAAEISYEFAPLLNNSVSNVMKQITNNKYGDIKIDRDLNVLIFDNDSKMNLNVNGVSRGTIDQVFLSMRFGINNIITKTTFPFILDDSFVNYDKIRLSNILKTIQEESLNVGRQVILFTCQNRENDILTHLNSSFNYIEI